MAIETIRIQAEDSGVVRGSTGSANPSQTVPVVVAAATAVERDRPFAEAADGDAYVDFVAASGEYIEFKVSVDVSDHYDLGVGYALGGTDNRSMRLDVKHGGNAFVMVDRMFDLPTTGDFSKYTEQGTRVYLTAGENAIRLTSNGYSGPNIDYLEVRPADPNVAVFQGEGLASPLTKFENTGKGLINRAISPTTTPGNEQFRTGAEGEAYLDWAAIPSNPSATDRAAVSAAVADFTFVAPSAGRYAVTLTYATSTARPLDLKLVNADGQTSQLSTFAISSTAPTGPNRLLPTDRADLLGAGDNHDNTSEINNAVVTAFENWKTETISVDLAAGSNKLRLQLPPNATTGPNIDKIVVKLVEAAATPQAPTDITVDALTVSENAAGAAVGKVLVTDADSTTHTFQVTENGTASTRFEVIDGTLRLKAGVALDYEGQRSYPLTIAATDADGKSFSKSFTVAVTNVTGDDAPTNQPATALVLSAVTVAENVAGAVVAALAITDVDTSYAATDVALSGADAAKFRVIGTPGALQLALAEGVSLDAEAASPPSVTVTAGGLTQVFTPAPSNVNEAPTLSGTLADATVPSTGGSVSLAGLTKADVDGDTTTFGVRAASGTLPAGISVADGALVVADGVAPGTYPVEVFATDGTLNSGPVALMLTVGAPVKPFTQILIQAEAGTLRILDTDPNTNDTTIRNPWNRETPSPAGVVDGLRPGFSGSGYLDFGDTAGDRASYSFTVAQAGSYDIQIRYASNGARPLAFTLDGVAQEPALPFIATGTGPAGSATEGFNNWSVQKVTVQLTAGTHSFSLAIPAGATTGPNIDAIAITAAGATADFSAGNSTPVVSGTGFSVAEGTLAVGTVSASDLDGDRVDFALTANAATDNALFTLDARTGALRFKAAPNFEAPGDAGADNAYTVEVEAFDGTARVTKTLTVTVTNDPSDDVVNRAPVIVSSAFTANENQTAVGTVQASDADAADTLTYALTTNASSDNALFSIDAATGVLTFKAAPDYETLANKTLTAEVAVTDGKLTTTKTIAVTVADVNEGGPVAIKLGAITPYSAQDRPQDGGQGAALLDGGTGLSLDGNLWKRAAIDKAYELTATTKLVFDVAIGTGAKVPEIVAVGFDFNEDPFDAGRSIYQLGGTQSQQGFIDLRGKGTPNPDGITRFEIDLGAHAGKTIASLVFVNDDDSRASLGSSSYSNLQFVEKTAEVANRAPTVVGGGIADRTVPEDGALEIDLPFADADGDALTYGFVIRNGAGAEVPAPATLSIVDGVLTGPVAALGDGIFTVTVTASDGKVSASDSFTLTVENVNEAPVGEDVALEPYFGSVGAAFDGFDVNSFAEYFSDPDGDALTLSVEGLPDGLSMNEEGYVSGSPTAAGTFEIKVRATDASGLSDTIALTLVVEGPQTGDVVSVEAEAFTKLGATAGFFATGSATASGERLILLNQGGQGSVSTELAKNGLVPGYYKVTLYAFDETDGASTVSVTVGDTKLTVGGSSTVTLNDAGAGTFVDPTAPRGATSQAGNLKAIAFDTVVYVGADTIATLAGQAQGGESLRIDRLAFTRVETPNTAPSAVTLTGSVDENAAGAVVGVLSATDAENDAVTFTTGDSRFVIVKNATTGAVELKLAAGTALDHETDDGAQVSVTATDAKGNATAASVTLRVNDLNEAPVLSGTIGAQTFEAGEGGEINLAALSATDPDAGDAATLVVKLASDAALPAGFTVENGVLKLAATVPAGTYEVAVVATDGEANSQPVSFTVTVEEPGTAEPFEPIVIQAESGTIALAAAADTSSTQIRNAANPETGSQFPGGSGLRPDFSGTGYLDFGNDAGDRVTYTVTVAEAGTYDLKVRYASNDLRPLDLAVNGGAAARVDFASTDTNAANVAPEGFDVWSVLTRPVTLQAGTNTISFAIPAGRTNGPNLDRIEIAAQADTSADADGNLFLSGPDVPLTGAAKESINFTIAGRDADIVKTEISFDGGATRVTVLPDADGDFVANGSALVPGAYTATVYVTDRAGNTASAAMPFTVGTGQVTVPPFTIQAEDATKVTVQDTGLPTDAAFTRVVTAATPDSSGDYRAGANGGAYMDFGGNAGDAITISVDAPEGGTYAVTFRYANGGAVDRPLSLSLNGGSATSVAFVPGPVVGTGATATGWESWIEKTVDLTLAKGANTLKLAIPAGAAAGPNIDQITFTHKNGTTPSQPFNLTIEAETFTPIDTTGTAAELTQARTAANPETRVLPRDVDNNSLWDGFTGTGYLDMGTQAGDAASFSVAAPEAGTYTFSFRYANGGGAPNGDRPMTVLVNGVTKTVSFPGTGVDGWDAWRTATVELDLAAGQNLVRIANAGANGPNIDSVTISRDGDGPVDTREQIRFEKVIKVNFEPAPGQTSQGLPPGYTTPTGYQADTGAAFGDRGNGFTYGWVTEASVADGTANGTIAAAQPADAHWYKSTVPGATNLQKTYAHFEYPGAGAAGARAWEMALENGTYQVTMSIGDTAGAFDSEYRINLEGQSAMPAWKPANPIDGSLNGGGFRSTLVTKMVTVTDGRLTVDSLGGTNTEIQYLEIERVADLTPGDGRAADLDYSLFVAPVAANLDGQRSIALGSGGELPTGIDPSSSFVVGVQLQAAGNRGPNVAHVDHVKLVETLTGAEVSIDVQISGGADSLTIRPLQQLKENTSYTLKVQDVLDLGSISDPNGALRQFQDLTSTFVTGKAAENVPRNVAFSTQTLLDGFADGAGGYTSIEFGPDGKLYVATITGEIHRWSVNANGTINKTSQETLNLPYLKEADNDSRGIVGLAFDPENPNTIWITDNAPIPREAKAFDTPEFSGRVSKITLGTNGSFTGVKAETYITGLPRSGGDHLTNSLEFRANPNAGQAGEPNYLLYISQGSNSAAGAPDDAWGARPERLLNAAILEVDPRRSAPNGGFNVSTEPVSPTDDPKTSFPANQFNPDGTYPGSYNPFAEDAVLKIFATGVRNAYDLVWHSNGKLYVPTNGTASGGKTPNDPTQPGLDTVISNSPKQYDYFFTVEEGKYYGHPNVLRDEYVLNGGNPTNSLDPNEVVGGNDGNRNTDGYATGVKPDADYDLDGVYNLGYNRSPNGATEYKGNAFGPNLKGAILFAQFSTGDNVRAIKVDAQGNIIGDEVLRRPDGSVIDNYIDPLDIIENPVTGQLYLMTLNRGTGASQLILLTPAPGGVTADLTADEGNNLALVAVDVSDPSKAVFQVNGLDSDITAIRVSFNNGPESAVTLDAQNRFTIDLGSLSGAVSARLRITDDAMNQAAASTTFTPGEEPTTPDYVTLVTIQAEDRTPADGTAVTVPTGSAAQIQIRDAANPEQGVTGAGYVNGLRPGAFGTDGNTSNSDGVPGGYADFGSTNADFMTFAFSADKAGPAVLKFRYANGGTADRPLQLEVNGSIIKVQSFAPTATATVTDGWTNWAEIEVPVTLAAGQNSVTLRSVNATGPNIDQLVVLVPTATGTVPNDGEMVVGGVPYLRYEAEKAALGGAPAIVTEGRNQSGAFVDFLGPDTETITWTVEVGTAGTYGVDILYALGAGKAARPMALAVNGEARETLPFTANSSTAEDVWGPQTVALQLKAGINTIALTAPGGVAPNLDYLRVTKAPVSVFTPDYADIVGSGRIELETQNGSAHIVNGSTVEFFFTVSADGVYKIDTAANANAANGQGLTWLLNGVAVDDSAFPGVGTAGEASVYLELKAGTEYRLRLVSDAPGASALDYLDIGRAPGNPNADIAVQSLDPAFFDNRLHFSFLEDPDAVAPDAADRDFKASGTVRITNTGTEALTLTDHELTGPFVLANPAQLDGLSIAPGASVNVTVTFNRAAYTPPTSNVDATSTVFQGALKLITNDADDPVTTIDLAGFWQARDEGGQEPNVNEVWRIFGFGNVIEGLTLRGGGENSTLSTKDVFAKTDPTEVLSPYWKLADGVSEAKITHIAAFHGTGGATIHLHNPGNKGQNVQLWDHQGTDNQRILPNAANGTDFASVTFNNGRIPDNWVGNEVFGISVAGLSTDPRLNPVGGEVVPGAQQGHTVKMFEALDTKGNVIPNVYLGIMDYTGINYDYNDNMFVIEGVRPVGFGQDLRIAGLDDAAADERLVFTNIDTPANAQQAFRNEATFTIANDGSAALEIGSIVLGDPAAFQIVGTPPTSIAAGASAQVTVRFTGTHAGTSGGADLYKSTLTITSNDFTDGVKVIQLAGLAQEFSENNSEPTVAQIVQAFGYTTDMAQGELADGGKVEAVGDEVLMPYLERLDAGRPVEVIQMAAFLQQGNVARLGVHGLASRQVTNLFANDDQQGQTVLPDQLVAGAGAGANVARGTINATTPFGLYISVDGRPTYSSWTDPEANKIDPAFGQLVGDDQGHLIRFFQALDAAGQAIAGTFIGIQDYPGAGNYDYNDHMFVIKNVKAHALTAAEDANGDRINDALQLDADRDGTVNFFDTTTTPPTGPQQPFGGTAPAVGAAPITIDATRFDTGGQGVAYNDTTPTQDQGGTAGRNEGVDVIGNNAAVGWIQNGEWIEYTINVERAGLHSLSFAAASPDPGRTITASFEQNGVTYLNAPAVAVVDTNNYTSFTPTAPIQVNLAAGIQTVRLSFGGGTSDLFDFDSFTLDRVNIAPTVAQTLPAQTATQGQAFSYTLPAGLFTDADGDALSLSVSGLPSGLAFNATTRVISGTPTVSGQLSLTVTASDGTASTSTPLALAVAPGSTGPQTPFGGTVPAFANGVLTVDASNYDEGGQGVAYNDAAGLQGGTNGGRTGSAVEQTAAGDIGWIDAGEWLEYTINVPTNGAYDVDLLLSNGGGTGRSAKVDFYKSGAATPYATSGAIANPSTGSFNTFAARGADAVPLDAGQQVVRVTFSGGNQDFRAFTLTAPSNPQAPFGGTAPAFTNGVLTVDASNFDTGGQGVAYSDNAGKDGGTNFRSGEAVEFVGAQDDIGYVRPGEWIEYTINVPQGGTYDLNLLAKTPLGNAMVAVSLAGGATLATVALRDGGASFDAAPFETSPSVALALPAGQQTLRLTFDGTPQAGSPYLLDLRSFTLDYREPTGPAQAPFSGTPVPVGSNPVTVSAALFDRGGQGVAYNDTTPSLDQGGTAGRNEGVDIVGNNAAIGWIADGEWVEYTLNLAQAGRYSLTFSTATPDPGRTITASFEQNGAVYKTAGTASVVDTNSYTAFTATQPVQLDLNAGVQTVRLLFNGGAMDVQSFTIDRLDPASPNGQGAASPTANPLTGTSSPVSADGLSVSGGLTEALDPGAEILALYDAVLGRIPDPVGFQDYMAARSGGTSVHALAENMLRSEEGQASLGLGDDRDFVEALYRIALDRAGEPAGVQDALDGLAGGMSRSDVLAVFALSQENLAGLRDSAPSFFSSNMHESAVMRLYHGLLDRAPDPVGLSDYARAVAGGTALKEVAQSMLTSAEYLGRHAGLSDGDFVGALIARACGRPADSGEWQHYVDALGLGAARQDVAVKITQSLEAYTHLTTQPEPVPAPQSVTIACFAQPAPEPDYLIRSMEIA